MTLTASPKSGVSQGCFERNPHVQIVGPTAEIYEVELAAVNADHRRDVTELPSGFTGIRPFELRKDRVLNGGDRRIIEPRNDDGKELAGGHSTIVMSLAASSEP